MYIIYRHINKINGKSYIGQTNQKVKERWNIHCRKFYNAIKEQK